MLVNPGIRAVICDFGLSRIVGVVAVDSGGKGTPRWQSPEIMMGGPRSFQGDVYAFGITIYEVCITP